MARERRTPGTLSRERIVDVALELAQREGPDALSMRRIAAELGTGAMSLYNHVPDKAALLEAIAEKVLAEVDLPDRTAWPEVARAWATSLRTTLLRHRPIVGVVMLANNGRPLQSVSQDLVAALERAELPASQARKVMRAVGRFVAGSIMLDAGALHSGRTTDQGRLDRTFEFGLDALLDGLQRALGAPSDATAR